MNFFLFDVSITTGSVKFLVFGGSLRAEFFSILLLASL